MKRTRSQMVHHLIGEGLSFSEFRLTHEGDYTVSDADWNYKDVPHLHYVHELVESVIGLVTDNEVATINMQKVLGVTLPMTVFNYQSSPGTQTYFTTLLFFTLIIETSYEEVSPNKTRVHTTYSIGSSKWWRWAHSVIQWTIKRNYANLMSQDIPMRTRRGQLRSWGYSFYNDSPLYGFEKTMDVSKSNVILPEKSPEFSSVSVSLDTDMPNPSERFIGRDDHLGLRLVRSERTIALYPRMCPHEGSSLDAKACVNNRVRCHWHGRLFGPLGVLDLTDSKSQELMLQNHLVTLDGNVLTVKMKQSTPMAIPIA